MTLRFIALLVPGLFVLICETWAMVDVSMQDVVEVNMKEEAMIPCVYMLKEPPKMIVWFTVQAGKDPSRIRIYSSDNQTDYTVQGSNYDGRIKVTQSHEMENTQGTAALTISNVQLSDEREFICVVHSMNESGEGRTRLKVFNLPSLPVIELKHTGISVTETEPSKVAECTVDNGYPRPNITWYKDSFPLQSSESGTIIRESETIKPSGLFTVQSELSLKVVEEDKDAIVYCEVTYFAPGEVRMQESKRVNIEVHYPTTEVTLSVFPDTLLKEGDSVVFRCKGNGNPQPPFTFRHKEREIYTDEGILLLQNVTRSHSGKYVCETTDYDIFMTYEDTINITVHYLDHIVVTPEENVLNQGENLTLTCNALSSLPTTTAWYKDDVHQVEGHLLKLHTVSYNNAGKYMCEVMVPSLPELRRKKVIQINVQGKPEVKNITVERTNNAGHSVKVICSAEGYPVPKITWSLSDRKTGEALSAVNQEMDISVTSTISLNATSDLTVNCTAENQFGTDYHTYNIQGIKTTPTTQPTKTEVYPTSTAVPPKQTQKGGSGVIIAVLIICLLLIAILGSVLYFLYKKGKLPCGRSGKKDFMKQKSGKDDSVMESKSGKSEEAVLLQGVNGDKKSPTE